MASKKHGLGRGLNALLVGARSTVEVATKTPSELSNPAESLNTKLEQASQKMNPDAGLLEIALEQLRPGQYQPRKKMRPEELESLADSIRAQGILQPLVVRRILEPNSPASAQNKNQFDSASSAAQIGTASQKFQYEIIAGERRFRAAGIAGLTKVPVIVKQVPDEKALAIALIENIQRENLNALEEAMALERLIKEFNFTHIEAAEAVGKSRTSITNSLRLLTLAEEVKEFLERGDIEAGHAKVLLGLRGQEQTDIAKQVVAKGLSVRETERLIANKLQNKEDLFHKRQWLDPDVKRLIENLSEKLGARVDIQQGQQGKGKLVIQYNSLEELEGILEHIR